MSIHNLDALFQPNSIALIGASQRAGSVGAAVARNLFRTGFDGPVMPVNPKHQAIEGVLAYPDVESLPLTPDLAVLATPPDSIPDSVEELGRRGTRAAVVITAGFEGGEDSEGGERRRRLMEAAGRHRLRVVGPNCLGFISPPAGLNASFAHLSPESGRIAFATQSGAIVTSVIGWAHQRGIGFSHLASLGDMTDVDFGDLLDYLATDATTRAILLYVEQVTNPRKFMSAARAAARSKPVIVVKGGRHAAAAKAVASHTGSVAGADAVYDAVFRRAGMLRVDGLEKLFEAVEILAMTRPPRGDRVAVLTNGGGIGVLATDTLLEHGGRLAELSDDTMKTLDQQLPAAWSHGNPVDVLGDAGGERYSRAITALTQDRNVDAILAMHCPTAVGDAAGTSEAIARVAPHGRDKPTLLTAWVGDVVTEELRQRLTEQGVPAYETPEQAVRAFMYTVTYRRNQEALMETPSSVPEEFQPDTARARGILDRAREDGRTWLSEAESKDLLAAYGVPVVTTRTAHTPEEAAAIAAEMSVPVVLKILSPDLTHKSDIGGVALNVQGPAAAKRAAQDMLEAVRAQNAEARLDGFSVQPMVHRPGAYELLVGMTEDAQFGPVIVFGQGGGAVEVLGDTALGLPPLNMHLAGELMARTRIHRQLEGYRGQEAANLEAIQLTLIKVAQIAAELPEVAELDVNPLLADAYGVVALDARVRVQAPQCQSSERLAIRPYPKKLEERIHVGHEGHEFLIRPVVPEDEHAFQRAFAKLSEDEVRLRFFAPLKTLSHVMAARFTQLDYNREMALILTDPGIPGTTDLYGVVSITTDPDNVEAEYALLVRGDMTGQGLGILLMRRIIDYARSRGTKRIYGDVLEENEPMLKLCKVLGFRQERVPDEPGLMRVTLELNGDGGKAG